jgi:hypothetical protein
MSDAHTYLVRGWHGDRTIGGSTILANSAEEAKDTYCAFFRMSGQIPDAVDVYNDPADTDAGPELQWRAE